MKKNDTAKIWTCCPKVRDQYLKQLYRYLLFVHFKKPEFIVVDETVFIDSKLKYKFLKKIRKHKNVVRIYVSNTDVFPDMNFFDYAFFNNNNYKSNFSRIKTFSTGDDFKKELLMIFQSRIIVRPNNYFVMRYYSMHENMVYSHLDKFFLKIHNKVSTKITKIKGVFK
jgi:hypothetical protein